MRVRIGLSMAPREIEVDVEEPDALASEIEQAIESGRPIVWVTDRQGIKHGLAVSKIAFIEVETEEADRGVGFSSD